MVTVVLGQEMLPVPARQLCHSSKYGGTGSWCCCLAGVTGKSGLWKMLTAVTKGCVALSPKMGQLCSVGTTNQGVHAGVQ